MYTTSIKDLLYLSTLPRFWEAFQKNGHFDLNVKVVRAEGLKVSGTPLIPILKRERTNLDCHPLEELVNRREQLKTNSNFTAQVASCRHSSEQWDPNTDSSTTTAATQRALPLELNSCGKS